MSFLRYALLLSFLLLLLAGCGGSGGSATSTTGSGSSGTTTTTTPTTPAYTGAYIFVVQNTQVFGGRTNGALLKFRADGSGAVTPAATITTTGNGGFYGLAADSAGVVYATSANTTTNGASYVVRYSSGASGETQPSRADLAAYAPEHMAAGPTGDLLFTTSLSSPVTRYTVSSSGISKAQSLPTFYAGGKATTLIQPFSAAQDSAGNLYVSDVEGIKIFTGTATDDVAPARTIAGASTTIVSNNINTNKGNTYSIPAALVVNATGELYVGMSYCTVDNTAHTTTCTGGVIVFAAGANGNVAPIRILSGDQTTLNAPVELSFDKTGNLYVLDYTTLPTGQRTGRVVRFSGTATGNVAPLNSFSSAAWTESVSRNMAVVN